MPVQINEMVITVEVESAARQAGAATATSAPPNENGSKKLVEECLDQVMEIMRNKNER